MYGLFEIDNTWGNIWFMEIDNTWELYGLLEIDITWGNIWFIGDRHHLGKYVVYWR